MTKEYKISLSENQLQIISKALDVYSRLGIGQFRDALECLPTQEFRPNGWNESMDEIGNIVKQFTHDNVDGYRSSLGIMNTKTKDQFRVAWDIQQVIRHKISWDNHKDGDSTFTVNFHEPFKSSEKEPLVKIEKLK